MTTSIYGWCGKILKIDLSESRVSEMNTMDYADRFLGGRGIATRIYWEEVGPGVSAFDPENHLIFMTGPLGLPVPRVLPGLKLLASPPC